ncbi:ubiquitin carboxyl-terminal hydrolase 2-like [Ostrea edulis]|uniref:ubiquitin carboxyl-terminal hydrolase 2-like n=1 Tax=Ostrea edulis TaxID=37623 RepID=UPI0020952026|nr:ubiquitin carboxyl-terminal hydrolase 2-like [Ostrea edulis]XP_048777302.1 ubiquitin carboxyl-terminal hydrolase 2-like [Ostrea edulis]XP_048777303.1 ubiquitin carboxyl-terminal hydrolase 2-like [Ostrea edulis]
MTTYYSGYNMPGVPRSTGYSGSYSSGSTRTLPRQRTSSLNRENSATRNFTQSSKPPRPLPNGPGPLDSNGRKIDGTGLYKIKTTSSSSLRSPGPIKATNTYNSTYSTSYGTAYGTGSLSRPDSGLKQRRSTSISNINDRLSDLKVTDTESRRSRNRDESNGFSSYRSSHDDYTPRSSKSKLDNDKNDDIFSTSRTSSRNSKFLKDNNSFDLNDDSYTPTISRKRDGSLPPMSRKDSSSLDSKSSFTRQNSVSPTSVNGSISQHLNGGKVGLRNLGNTCFMNSVLQCLSNTKPLLEYFVKEDFILDKNTSISSMKGQLVTAYANLMKSMWAERSDSHVSPNAFKTQIQRFAPRFMGYAQQDAQEFLRYLLEGLHEDVNKVTSKPKPVTIQDDDFSNDQDKAKEYWRVYLTYDNSHIVEIFVGQLKSELKFDCDHRSVTFDPFWDLSVPIPKVSLSMRSDVNIIQCITAFMKAEVLDGEERPTCSVCKKRMRCTKSFSIQRFPTILVLHLKRFSQGRYSQKVSTCIDFPLVLDMSEYSAEKGGKRVLYNLYGVSNHSGGVHSGHYTANCKHPYNGEWNVFSDTRVSPTSASRAVSSEAYLLFYERVTDPSRL